MHGTGLAAEHFGGLHELFRGLQFAFGVDYLGPPFTFGLGLFGDGAHHRLIQVDVFDLDIGDLDAPGIGLRVEHLLDVDVQLLALGQQLIQFMFTEHGAQRGLRQLAGGGEEIFDLDDGLLRIEHAEIQHRVNLNRNVVAGNHILRRHIENHGAQVDPNHLLHHRNQQDQPWAFDLPETPELEYHPALVFTQDAKRRSGQDDHQQQQRNKTDLQTHDHSPC